MQKKTYPHTLASIGTFWKRKVQKEHSIICPLRKVVPFEPGKKGLSRQTSTRRVSLSGEKETWPPRRGLPSRKRRRKFAVPQLSAESEKDMGGILLCGSKKMKCSIKEKRDKSLWHKFHQQPMPARSTGGWEPRVPETQLHLWKAAENLPKS